MSKARKPTYVLTAGTRHVKYGQIAHHPGGILWWLDGKGRFRTLVSTGREFHDDLDHRVNMDARWRGRVDVEQCIATMLPPIELYGLPPDRIPVPGKVVLKLLKMGAHSILVDTTGGLRRLERVRDETTEQKMDKESESKMLEEVALRNAIGVFRRKNAALTGKASTPEVGIFWIDDHGRMFAAGVSLRDAGDYGKFRIFEKGHLESWNAAIRANASWRDLEYEEVPRGRVVYRRDPKKPEFIVYMPRRLGKHRNKVIRRFNLPSGYVRFDFDDAHYQMNRGGLPVHS